MMSHFNFKSLVFYGITIVLVVALFDIVTAYGEKNLKAPAAIDGSYPLSFAEVPACLKSNPLVLTIQQSGTYLNASLLPTNTNSKPASAAAKKPSLTGQMKNQQVSITGPAPAKICNSAAPPSRISIQGQVEIQGREGKSLKGTLSLLNAAAGATSGGPLSSPPGIPGNVEFTAQRQPPAKKVE